MALRRPRKIRVAGQEFHWKLGHFCNLANEDGMAPHATRCRVILFNPQTGRKATRSLDLSPDGGWTPKAVTSAHVEGLIKEALQEGEL